tara:strand:+ start:287 stop:1027 length:741 start_codon:yes stop_codon:yes gene_type:complete
MPTITSNTTDGYQSSGLQAAWADTRESPSAGISVNATDTVSSWFGIRAAHTTSRGGRYFIVRTFFDFDVEGIDEVASATFNVRSYLNVSATGIVLKSGHDPSDTSTTWYTTWLTGLGGTNASDWESGDTGVVEFSSQQSAALGFTSYTLNSDAISHINSIRGNTGAAALFKIVVMEYNHDYLNVTQADGVAELTGYYYANHGTSTVRPYLDYATTSAGYGNNVAGVDDIAKVNGTAVASIEKVIGV